MVIERTVRQFINEVNRLRGDYLLEIWYSPRNGTEILYEEEPYALGHGVDERTVLQSAVQEAILRYFGLEQVGIDLGLDSPE